ncbi:unnamed protein product [Rotaria socialis]|uniref:F-box domain-containing protein n=1 Tax=Rotaria socialis TaxID=392032 RepID=A0A821XZV9_9BILA|nr:unnamed protein product [Rotaria socialis]
MNMSTFNNNDINIFDLSDELLLYIFKKLHTIELLYSLVNVNQRFDRLVLDPFYTHHLDLTVRPLRYYTSPVKTQIFDRIRTQVLPRIHQKLNKITVDPLSMECILGTIYYSELNSLSLVNFQSETLLQHLTAEISDSSSNIDNTKNLPKLKCLTLTSQWYTYFYNDLIFPLLLSIIRNVTTYIDGTQLHNDFLINMPRLNKFIFSIHTYIINDRIEIDLPSRNDILNSFLERGYQQVHSYADEKLTFNRGFCHVYSLPYHFNDFIFMTSGFQGGTFSKVRRLVMLDIRPFENELFQVIAQDFPFPQRLSITNLYSQQNKQHLSTSITFAHLFDFDLARANIDYVVQFLFDKNTSLPCLMHLTVRYETLATVTRGFTNDAAHLTCSKIRCLVVKEPFVRPEKFLSYFSSL